MSNEKKLVPKLRFEDYKSEQEWEKLRVEDLGEIVTGTTPPTNDNSNYGGQYLFISPVDIQENRYVDNTVTRLSKKGFEKGRILPEGTTLFVSIGSTIGKVAQIRKKAVTNQQINAIIPNPKYNSNFILSLFKKYTKEIRKISSAQAVPIINKNTLSNYEVITTKNIKEQQQIGTFFKKIDKMIQLQQSKVNKAKDIKSAYLSEMFPKEGEKYPKKRFEGFTEPWTAKKLGSLLDYEQPTNYLVKSDSYDDSYLTPVLTAGKSFLLGYTNETEGIYKADNNNGVIIFDDFTTSSHFVDFDFKVKSSAMKFLRTNQSNFNLYFLYNLLTSINYSPESHERHWISIFSEFEVLVPTKKEQEKIGQFFKNLDNQISIEEEKLSKLEKLKQAYLNDMFV